MSSLYSLQAYPLTIFMKLIMLFQCSLIAFKAANAICQHAILSPALSTPSTPTNPFIQALVYMWLVTIN